jgi:hypothetical protein
VEVLTMQDCKPASRRQLHLNFQPKDNDSLMRTVDTRFTGSFAYEVQYPVRHFFDVSVGSANALI